MIYSAGSARAMLSRARVQISTQSYAGLIIMLLRGSRIQVFAKSVAVKTQRTKHANLLLTQRLDRYFTAWR